MTKNKYSVKELTSKEKYKCACGKEHSAHLKFAEVGRNAIAKLPEHINKFNASRAYILADENTLAAAGDRVFAALDGAGIKYTLFSFGSEHIEPDEKAVGSAVLNFDHSCDILIGIGSGVINDIGKIVAKMTSLPYIIVGTAPSMDGYASSTSSVIRGGLKVSVDSKCPDVVIGDTEVLCAAPLLMIEAGLGDMLAKYVSVCEWRIGHIVTGEYYCEEVASMIRAALKKCIDNAGGIINRDEKAVESVMEGLILSGIAADYAGVSRPVSGVEHYFSHLWDMRAVEFGTPWSLHGIQCGIGTYLAAKGYEKLKTLTPDRETAVSSFKSANLDSWLLKLKEYLGSSADAIIRTAPSSDRYNAEKHLERLENMIAHWDEIKNIADEELPPAADILEILKLTGSPVSSAEIGIPCDENAFTFKATKDIRDKYILSTLMWDMGVLDKADEIYG